MPVSGAADRCWGLATAVVACCVACCVDSACAQFTTVVNVPPDTPPTVIGSDTQVNVLAGGALPDNVDAGLSNRTSSNIEINIDGGTVGHYFDAYSGSIVNLIDGTIGGYFEALWGSVVNISGGTVSAYMGTQFGSVVNVSDGNIGGRAHARGQFNVSGGTIQNYFQAAPGSQVAIRGGSIGYGFEAHEDSDVEINGGRFWSHFIAESGSSLRIAGGAYADVFQLSSGSSAVLVGDSFQLNDEPIAGLSKVGNTLPFDLPAGSILSGVFADGTPFAFSPADGDVLADGVITLEVAELPPIGPSTITSSTDPVPLGIRDGQTLIVDDGSVLKHNFVAGPGSTLVVETGGMVGLYAKAIGGHVTINGGQIDQDFDAMLGSVVDLHDGELGHEAEIYDGGLLNVFGGEVSGWLYIKPGGSLHVEGGLVARVIAESGSYVAMRGGQLTVAPDALAGSEFEVSGGIIQPGLEAHEGSQLTLHGGEFRLNGTPVEGLNAPGDSQQLDLPAGGVLTCVLADGTPIALSAAGASNPPFVNFPSDQIASGVLTLVAAEVPDVSPATITAPADPVPMGLRGGQTLVVGAGGVVPDRFTAIEGSTVRLLDGGEIGYSFEAVGIQVEVLGGLLRSGAIYHDSVMNISAGTVVSLFAGHGTEVNIQDDAVVSSLVAGSGSVANISGGDVNVGGRDQPIIVHDGASLYFTGHATTSGLSAAPGGSITLSGGEIINELDAAANAFVHLIGTEFLLDGAPISGLSVGAPFVLADRGGVLSGKFATGQSFEFELNATNNVFREDYFDEQALLTLTLIVPGDFNLDGFVNAADYESWRSGFDAVAAEFGNGADGNFDGKIDAADYVVWRRNFNRSDATALSESALPEPAGIAHMLAILIASAPVWRYGGTPYRRRMSRKKSLLPA